MDINFFFSYCALCYLASLAKAFHKTSPVQRPGQIMNPPKGVFHAGPPPPQFVNTGRKMIFTNPPPVQIIPARPTAPMYPPPMYHRPPPPPPTTTVPPPTTTKAFDWDMYYATTYPSTKKGKCPNFNAVHAECYGRCHKDDDCFYERKCCRDGFGFGCCIDPVKPGIFDNLFGGLFGPTTSSFGVASGFGDYTSGTIPTDSSYGGPTTSAFFWKKKK